LSGGGECKREGEGEGGEGTKELDSGVSAGGCKQYPGLVRLHEAVLLQHDILHPPATFTGAFPSAGVLCNPPFPSRASFAGLINVFKIWLGLLLQLLYTRLSSCKEEGRKHAREKFRHLVANPIAVELGMDDSQGPSSVQEQILRDRGAEDNEEALYQYLLEACEKLFMNELDQAAFEEHMRWFFGTKVGSLVTAHIL